MSITRLLEEFTPSPTFPAFIQILETEGEKIHVTGLREFTATLSISIRFVYLRIIHSSSSSKLSTKQQLLLVVKSSRKAIMKMSHILQNHYCACSSLRCGLVTITVNSAIFKVKKNTESNSSRFAL